MPFVMMNPLIVMMGMSIYDKFSQLPQLYSCYKDYRNIIKAFNFIHGYSIAYLNENNDLIYIDKKIVDSKDIDDKFKLKWTCDEIETFNQQIKQEILHGSNKYNHDSLIYIISCHGNRDESIYDYNGEQYSLDYIYHEFSNKECKILREKPKLFIIDADRVDINVVQQTKVEKQQKKLTGARLTQQDESKDENQLKLNLNQVSSSSTASQSFTTDSHLRKIFCNTKDEKLVATGKNVAFLIQALTSVLLSKSNNNIYAKTFSQLLREMRIIMSQLMAIPNQSVVIHDRNSLPYKIQFGRYNSDNINFNCNYDEFKSENKSSESNLNMVNNDTEPQIYTMCKPLIVFLGISKYSGMNNLDCVPTDFENILKSFHIKRGYHIAYCHKNSGKLIIIDEFEKTKSISQHVSYLKLQWNENDIFLFDKMVFQYIAKNYTKDPKQYKNKNKSGSKGRRKNKNDSKTKNASNTKKIKIDKNKSKNKIGNSDSKEEDDNEKVCESINVKYDGLMYFISCHGDSGGIIYDSQCDELPLVTIFDQFNNQNCIYLRNKPKIYWVSACRGSRKTKRFANSNFVIRENDTLISDHDEVKTKPETNMENKDDNNSYDDHKTQLQEKKSINNINDDENQNSNNNQKCSNLHLFSKFNWNRVIYANTEGYGVVEPGSKGEYMIRSIEKAFVNDDIFKCDFDQIIVQIRKILVKLMGTSIECAAQVIDDHNDIPANLFFKSNNGNTSQEKQN